MFSEAPYVQKGLERADAQAIEIEFVSRFPLRLWGGGEMAELVTFNPSVGVKGHTVTVQYRLSSCIGGYGKGQDGAESAE